MKARLPLPALTVMPAVPALLLLLIVAGLAGGCSKPKRVPQLARLYDRAAQQSDLDRNPVIVIPGILGSKLVQESTGVKVWGAFGGGAANPERPEGARLVALPMRPDAPLSDLRDDVVAAGVLDDVQVQLLFVPLQLSAYRNILMALGVGGYRDESLGEAGTVDYGDDHYTCFQFDYDWRRDNVENAQRLHEFIQEKKSHIRAKLLERYGVDRDDIRFDIVAHSMGGLVARYFLRYGDAALPDDGPIPPPTWAGARDVDRVIMVGTPNAGSASAIVQLVEGTRLAPIVPKYEPAVLGTMPSIYQLLPRERHRPLLESDGDTPIEGLYDVALWERMGWGLAAPDQERILERLLPDVDDPGERRRIARDHLAKCLRRAERFHAALDTPGAPPGVELHLFAGDAEPTLATLEADASRSPLKSGRLRPREHGPGDRTVLRTSALMDERLDGEWAARLRSPLTFTSVRFMFTDHLGLTRDPSFTDNVLFLLLEDPAGRDE